MNMHIHQQPRKPNKPNKIEVEIVIGSEIQGLEITTDCDKHSLHYGAIAECCGKSVEVTRGTILQLIKHDKQYVCRSCGRSAGHKARHVNIDDQSYNDMMKLMTINSKNRN